MLDLLQEADSIVSAKPGDVITGRDRQGRLHTGTVTDVIESKEGTAYRLVNTGEVYGNGKPVEPVVTYLSHAEGYDPG